MLSAEPGSGPEHGSATDPTESFHHLLDWLVYAPVGVLTMVRKDLPGIIAAGKQRLDSQLTMARFVGKMAVRQVTTELDRRLDEAERLRQSAAAVIVDVPLDAVAPTSLPAAIINEVAHAPELVDAATLPIDGYESLAASQVVLRLGSLTAPELASIADYESSHRARRTILGKIHQLQAL